MTSMMAPSNIRLQFLGKFCNSKKKNVAKAEEFLKLSFNSSCNAMNNKRRFSLLVSASSHRNSRGVDTVNCMKNVPLAPITQGKLANESIKHTELVTLLRGRFVEDRFVYRQNFVVRSYQIGPDKNVTMETLRNFLQEIALNHASSCGISKNDFGTTHEMDLRKLIWVVTRIQVQVQRHGKWGHEIEVDTWFDAMGKNGTQRDWIIRDHYTKEILAKATSTWAVMNRETRRLSKIPEEVRQEVVPFYFNRIAIAREEIDHKKIHKLRDDTAQTFRSGMVLHAIHPGLNDMDVKEHVNNIVKYIGWILESMSREVLANYNMTSMTLEFRRECAQSDMLESMTTPSSSVIAASNNNSQN